MRALRLSRGLAAGLFACLFLLAGCNGEKKNNAGTTPPDQRPPAPQLAVVAELKLLRLSWIASARATRYEPRIANDGINWAPLADPLAATATGLALAVPVHLIDWPRARVEVRACNDSGCTSSNPVSLAGEMLKAIGYIKASNTDAGDLFGKSAVAISGDGNTMAVGARRESSRATGINGDQSDNSAPGAGAVYLFVRGSSGWSQQAYLKASVAETLDGFGHAVALSRDGNTLIVSAPNEDSAASGINGNQNDNGAVGSGAVYVFSRTGTTWSQSAYVKASNTRRDARFGQSVSIAADGNTFAVGATGDSSGPTGINGAQTDAGASFNGSGAVYVFVRTGVGWEQQAFIKASNAGGLDTFGWQVPLSGDGNLLVVGAPGESSNARGADGDQTNNGAPSSGAIYVFRRVGAFWTQQSYLKASNTGAGDQFGDAVAISADGRVIAAAALFESSGATGINGNQAANDAQGAGAVYVFTPGGASWVQQSYIKASNTGAGDGFGYSVALNGDGSLLAVGAQGEAGGAKGVNGNQADDSAPVAGAVYVFSREGHGWEQVSYVKAPSPDRNDGFGNGVALDAAGTTLAVSADGESGAARGIGGNALDNSASASGAVYLF